LHPDAPEESTERKPRPGEVPGELSEHLQANALDAGLVNMKRPSWTPNSLKPLQSIVHAHEMGKSVELRDALYAAYWEEDKDIGHLPIIQEVAEAQGIEWAPLEKALNGSRYLDTVLEEYQEGKDLGFDGIPAFVIGNIKFTGAQPMEIFRKVAKHAQQMLETDPQSFIGKRRVL
jgi:predicted DsbA family dithiol-disulfide isomerase